jgi:hypothetical protein
LITDVLQFRLHPYAIIIMNGRSLKRVVRRAYRIVNAHQSDVLLASWLDNSEIPYQTPTAVKRYGSYVPEAACGGMLAVIPIGPRQACNQATSCNCASPA